MLGSLFPRRVDEGYHGWRLALWILGLVLFIQLGIGVRSVFSARSVAITADGIPLDSYPPAAAQSIVAMFGLLGVSRLTLGLLGVLVLARWRALVPLVLALLLFDQIARKAVLHYLPIERVGAPPGAIATAVLLGLTVAALGLSLWPRRPPATAKP